MRCRALGVQRRALAAARMRCAWNQGESNDRCAGLGLRVRSEPPALRACSHARVQSAANRAVLDQGIFHGSPVQTRVCVVVRQSFGWGRVVNCGRALPPRCSRDSARRPGCVPERKNLVRFATPARCSPLPWRSQPSPSPKTALPLGGWRWRSPARCLLALFLRLWLKAGREPEPWIDPNQHPPQSARWPGAFGS